MNTACSHNVLHGLEHAKNFQYDKTVIPPDYTGEDHCSLYP